MVKITIVAGARPNFIKIAPIIHAIKDCKDIEYRLVHTGQHYDSKLSDSFFKDLNIPLPDINFNVGSGSHAHQTGLIMTYFEEDLKVNPCNYVLVVGDVNSTLACAIVAKKMHTALIHVESGLRSGDRTMPEEINRLVVDSISDYFFTTSREASMQLQNEGHPSSKIFFVGNVMIDTLIDNEKRFVPPTVLSKIRTKSYIAMTLHRPANVDKPEVLFSLLESIANSLDDNSVAIFPVHPRTRKIMEDWKLHDNIICTDPLPYLEFMYLVKFSKGVVTDSGGIQEETTFLGIPCITLRDNTERPETVSIGTNELIGSDTKKLEDSIKTILSEKWKKAQIPELWDGNSAKRIIEQIKKIASDAY